MNTMIFKLLFLVGFSTIAIGHVSGQFAPNFDITDTDGNQHRLYEDYLNHGKTVVIKLFFVGCPPCTNIAPAVQELYEEWGEGDYDVQFFEFTTKSSDSNSGINNYLNGLGVTIPASGQGGGFTAGEPYRMGDFGTYWGTPAFAVIDPDRNVVYFKSTGNVGEVHNAIVSTGALGDTTNIVIEDDPTLFSFNFSDAFGNPVTDVEVIIRDESITNNFEYPINLNTLQELSITDFQSEYPGLDNPIFSFAKAGLAKEGLSALDLISIQKHVLELDEFTDPDIILAADANNSGSVSAVDLITIQKLILNFTTQFPNGGDSWIIKQNDIPVDLSPGSTITIDVEMIKRGNVK